MDRESDISKIPLTTSKKTADLVTLSKKGGRGQEKGKI